MTSRTIIGFDVGGTKCSVGRFDANTFELLASKRYPTQAENGFEAVLSEMMEAIRELQSPDTVAIGIGVPGLVHQPDGIILRLPNIAGGENIPLQDLLTQK